MEKHAVSSNGAYYVWEFGTTNYAGPFFPNTHRERMEVFVRETRVRERTGDWRGAYFRRLPLSVRLAIRSDENRKSGRTATAVLGCGSVETVVKPVED